MKAILEVAAETTPDQIVQIKKAWDEEFPDTPCVVLQGIKFAGLVES